MTLDTLTDLATHPVAAVSVAVGLVSKIFSIGLIDAIATVTWMQIGSLFTGLSIASFTLGPQVDFLPEGSLTVLALVAGSLYLAKIGFGYVDEIEDRVEEERR